MAAIPVKAIAYMIMAIPVVVFIIAGLRTHFYVRTLLYLVFMQKGFSFVHDYTWYYTLKNNALVINAFVFK